MRWGGIGGSPGEGGKGPGPVTGGGTGKVVPELGLGASVPWEAAVAAGEASGTGAKKPGTAGT